MILDRPPEARRRSIVPETIRQIKGGSQSTPRFRHGTDMLVQVRPQHSGDAIWGYSESPASPEPVAPTNKGIPAAHAAPGGEVLDDVALERLSPAPVGPFAGTDLVTPPTSGRAVGEAGRGRSSSASIAAMALAWLS